MDDICDICGKRESEHKVRPSFIRELKRIEKEGYSEKINNSAEELRIEIEKM